MTRRKCNTELLETLYRAGVPVDEIAPQVGLASGPNVSAWASKMGLPLRNIAGKTAERDAEIYADFKRGSSRNEIAERFDLSPRTVQNAVLKASRAESGPQRISQKMTRAAAPVRQVIAAPKPAKVKIKFGFTPDAIKRYEARA